MEPALYGGEAVTDGFVFQANENIAVYHRDLFGTGTGDLYLSTLSFMSVSREDGRSFRLLYVAGVLRPRAGADEPGGSLRVSYIGTGLSITCDFVTDERAVLDLISRPTPVSAVEFNTLQRYGANPVH